MAQYVREVMSSLPVTMSEDETLADAARIMCEKDIGDVIVVKRGEKSDGKMCGIVTDRDIVVRGVAQGKDPSDTTLGEICSHQVYTLPAEAPIDQAVSLMREKGVRRLPIEEGGKPVGVISLGDLARERDQSSVLGQISSRPPNR